VRANASRLTDAELDEATELDRGNITELGSLYASLGSLLDLRVVGGCCGTDHEHVAAIAKALDRADLPVNGCQQVRDAELKSVG